MPVREGEGFDLLPGERVIHAEWDPPIFHLVLLLQNEPTNTVTINVRQKQDDG
ncbi:MAG: hypothetical protein LC798_19715 [Chloroflexi bacterium]|nr:hypothetical protein [Chloroflexota bacterium]